MVRVLQTVVAASKARRDMMESCRRQQRLVRAARRREDKALRENRLDVVPMLRDRRIAEEDRLRPLLKLCQQSVKKYDKAKRRLSFIATHEAIYVSTVEEMTYLQGGVYCLGALCCPSGLTCRLGMRYKFWVWVLDSKSKVSTLVLILMLDSSMTQWFNKWIC